MGLILTSSSSSFICLVEIFARSLQLFFCLFVFLVGEDTSVKKPRGLPENNVYSAFIYPL